MLAKNVNGYAGIQVARGACEFFASKLAPTQKSGLAEPFHPRCLGRVQIKGGGVLAARRMTTAFNQAVGKVGFACGELAQCLPDDIGVLDGQLSRVQQGFQHHYHCLLYTSPSPRDS